MPGTFISYRRDDAAGYAGRLHEALERRLGHDQIFRDIDTLEPGIDFVDAINARLHECRVFLALIGREWLDIRNGQGARRLDQAHDLVRLEIAGALARPDVRVIPVLIEGAAMPGPETLPEDIRPLARRHAVNLRDDAWDYDVDRLATIIAGVTGVPLAGVASATPAARSASHGSRRWIAIGAAVIVLGALATYFISQRDNGAASSSPSAPSSSGSNAAGGNTSSPGAAPVSAGARYGVPNPAVAEVAHVSLVYSLLSANVRPLGNGTSELRLRFRFANGGNYPANAWDSSFRLVAGSETLTPSSNLNEIVAGHSLKQGIVSFRIPSSATKVVLRILENDRAGELPLDVTPSSRPAEDERADAGDAFSRAIVETFVAKPRPLLRADDVNVVIVRATTRRFANVVRVRFVVRYVNAGRYPFGGATLRVAAGDEVLTPIEEPTVVIDGKSNGTTEVVFEVPPDTGRAVLRASIREAAAELPFEVPR